MKLFLSFFIFLTFFISNAFAQVNSADLQIEFARTDSYVVQIGKFEFRSEGEPIYIERISIGFHPVKIFRQERRSRKILYNGGVNLAANSLTYARFHRGNLIVEEVVPFETSPVAIVMTPEKFQQFKSIVEKQNFSSDKLDLLEAQLKQHHFESAQIAELMDVLSFDSDQLKFAKMAFLRTVDPQNYFFVSEKLTYSSSKRELNEYIVTLEFQP